MLFDGVDVTRLPIEQRNVGMVFQSYALFPNMSVAQNIGYGLRIRKLADAARARRASAEMLEMMRSRASADRRIDQLSGGQRQRVALARALAVRPRALLLDEPLTALDAKLRDTLRLEIDSLLRSLGITTIYVTHDQAEAMALGDRIVVMEHGRVAQIGTPREIYQRPATRFVAEFIGTMNRLTGATARRRLQLPAGIIRLGRGACAAHRNAVPPRGHRGRRDRRDERACNGSVAAAFFLGDRTRLFIDVGEEQPLVIETTARRDFAMARRWACAIDPRGLLVL